MTAPNLWYKATPDGPAVAMHVADPMAALLHFQARFAPQWASTVDRRAEAILERQRRGLAAETEYSKGKQYPPVQAAELALDAGGHASPAAGTELRPAAGAPGRTGVRLTSMAAIAKMRASGELNTRQAQLLEWVMAHPSAAGYTRQELARGMRWGVNQVCGRVHELIHAGILAEAGIRECMATGNSATAVVLAT